MTTALCPLLKEPCIEHRCKFYVHLLGKHPQTDEAVDKFDCAIAFLPVLLIEGAREARHIAAAVESLRNELTKQNEGLAQILFLAPKLHNATHGALREVQVNDTNEEALPHVRPR